MKLQISLALLLGASTLFANESLITKAKNAGLEAIPSNKQVLMKLIDDPKDQITDSKVSLVKSYILIQDFQEAILFHVTHVII